MCVQDSWQGSKGRQPFCRWGWTYAWTYTLCVHPPSGLWLSRLWLSRWTSATARELESAAYFFTEKAGYENTPSLTNGYCIPDRSPLGLHPSGHPAEGWSHNQPSEPKRLAPELTIGGLKMSTGPIMGTVLYQKSLDTSRVLISELSRYQQIYQQMRAVLSSCYRCEGLAITRSTA